MESTKVLDLTKKYPFLFETLVELSPKLKRLQNPVLQKTIGRKATLFDVSEIGKIPLQKVFETLAESIEKHTQDSVIVSKDGIAKGEWKDELEKRKDNLKELILDLHRGVEIEKLQVRFEDILKDVSATEIAEMEQSLISSGKLTAEQVTSLCDLHVLVFKESLDIQQKPESTPGHPIHTYMQENELAEKFIKRLREEPDDRNALEELKKITIHYARLQNQLFPILEKAGITGPSTVMWAKQDQIREMINTVNMSNLNDLLQAIEDMIYKENNILYPTALENLSEYDWVKVHVGEEEIGYSWIEPGNEWKPITPMDIHQVEQEADIPQIKLNTGNLSLTEIDLLLRHLPIDVTFVGADETVKYYSATDDRIFPRSAGVIGRSVINCHPRKSYDKVKEILTQFKEGKKDKALFWIQMNGKFILIGYYAVRDENGKFIGTLEATQDVTEIRSLEGEQRLITWDQE